MIYEIGFFESTIYYAIMAVSGWVILISHLLILVWIIRQLKRGKQNVQQHHRESSSLQTPIQMRKYLH